VEITQGLVGFASARSAQVTAGGVGIVAAAGPVELKASAAHLVLARDEAAVGQSAAGVVAGRSVEVRESAVRVPRAPRVDARNIRVLFTVPAAIAFGAAAGVALWLLGRVRH